ncbi:MAG TPA: glycosyltransferase family 1 protein [Lichenihabitans sp.]|jgi:glycosyltransferase involved in cell wall biosynthesis|nr:glycosyltransferase family 1 protein [Lichenihabitans sp.]
MVRHWSINGRFLTQRLTGVQRYAREIVCALDEAVDSGHPLARDLSIELLLPGDARDDLHLKAIRSRRIGVATGHIWEQFVLPRRLKGGLLSLGNVGPIAAARQIVCMHDTTALDCPASYSRRFRLSQRVLQPVLSRLAAQVTTVSSHSAERLVDHRLCRGQDLAVAPNGHEHVFRWRPVHSPATRAAAGPGTIVLIGTPAPHKNVSLLLGAASRLASKGFRLAVVGESDPRVFRGCSDLDGGNVIRLGRISDGELAALLKDSHCLAFPSLFEGFGLPVLEAMALGCPVVASDCAGLPALCGEAALYASPTRAEAWLDAFVRLRDDPVLRERMRRQGPARAGLFSWSASARIYLQAMAKADGLLNVPAVPASAQLSLDGRGSRQPCS